MAGQPNEADGDWDPAAPESTPAQAVPPRPTPTPGGPRGWLHRLRRASQPTPADLDPDAVSAGPPSHTSLARRSPFAIGFFITLGALTAFGLVFGLYRISSVVVLVMLALYVALGLNPLVDRLSSRGMRRGFAVLLVALAAIIVLGLAFWAILPVAYEQINRLLLNAPSLLQELRANQQIAALDARYDIINRVSTFLTSGELLGSMFGGLWGASQAVAGLLFSATMTIVLTLYFVASMEAVKDAILDLAPASRRPRVRYLANEMFSRIGGYVTGLFIVITCAATVAFLFLSIIGLGQYALALAVVVALCAVIPLIGSTLSMILVSIVAFTFSPTQGFITLAFFLTYQQFDNYFIQPRVFQRSVSVPGPLVILAAVCGGVLYGLLGALLAIPSMAALMLLYREVLIPALNRR
jgi:predicted PurR-regulated permease PerM